ncbi:MAG: HTTM domain-containing protein [Polyangiaceae bacterium]
MIEQWWGAFSRTLAKPRDAAALAVYRIAFGLMMAVSAFRFLHYGWVDELFVKPKFFFKYWALAWVPVPSATAVHGVFWSLVVLGLLIAVGLFYRAAIVAFLVLFSWVQAMDVTNYLNHYYLVALLALLMSTMPLGRVWGLDGRLFGCPLDELPSWCTYLLRFQISIVYFFAALAKFTPDWLLHGEPLRIWLAARTELPVIGPLFVHPMAAIAMSWAGFLYDATIWLFLLVRRTRPYAYVAVIVFHVLTRVLFPIGMFPVIMIVTGLVFFDSDLPRRVVHRLGFVFARKVRSTPPARISKGWGVVLSAYCVFQVLAPLRAYVYGGNVLWHEQGMRFSWRVMCREKNAAVTYWVLDRETRRVFIATPGAYLTDRQLREFAAQPDLVVQLAHHVGADYRRRTGHAVSVRAEVRASLNGRASRLLLDADRDLVEVEDSLLPAPFILPSPTDAPPKIEPIHA